jgi:guanylate kinase
MPGIIYVGGLSGAGKSTLTRAALLALPDLKMIPTYLTRAPRPGELEDAILGNHFVSLEEYDRLRTASASWDHTEAWGNYYETDAAAINEQIDRGQTFIVMSPPNVEELEEMQKRYRGKQMMIWIDVDLETSNKRLLERDGEKAHVRIKSAHQSEACAAAMREIADYVFTPSGYLDADKADFIDLVRRILSEADFG